MSNLPNEKPFAFVLMPFRPTHDDIYHLGIKETVEAAGMIGQRVDEQVFHREGIIQRIYNQIDAADLIIAEMTGRNPNVFYEVGYSHAKDKLCILLTQNADDIPFDLKHHRHIVYSSISDLRTKLAADLEAVRAELSARGSPIAVELKSSVGMLEKTKHSAYADTMYVFDLNNRTSNPSPEIHAMYLYCGPGWTFKQGGADCPTSPSEINGHKVDRHFLRCPVPILPRGGWAQLELKGRKLLASVINGQAIQDSYTLTGWIIVRVSTAKGDFDSTINVSLEVDEFPF